MNDGVLTIQPTTTPEIPRLAAFWYDVAVLRQQMNPQIQLLPDAQAQWEQAAYRWLHSADHFCLSASLEAQLVGAIFACREANAAGVAPRYVGRVLDLIVDIHLPQVQRGIGTRLLHALSATLREQALEYLLISIPPQAAIEQAFWRGVGAKRTADVFGMDLTK
jgi:GNAT superfamily N-acetyltransferase